MKNRITSMFGIELPLFAFSHCRDVVAECSKAGGMGVLGTTRLTPQQLEIELDWIDRHSGGKPYGLDLALPQKMGQVVSGSQRKATLPAAHVDFVERVLAEGGIPPLPDDEQRRLDAHAPGFRLTEEGGMELVDVALRHPNVRLVVSALGVAPPDMVSLLRSRGIRLGAMVGSPRHARAQLDAGMDLLIAQGMEAGAHTGNIASMVLWPQIVDIAGEIPLLAAGGIGRGRQMAAAFALGAQGVWCGSIWLGTRESELSPEMKQRLFEATSEDAIQRRIFTGKQCRMLRSRFTEAWDRPDAPEPLTMPEQGLLVAEARLRIERAGARDYMGYYVGQIVGDMRAETSVRQVMQDMVAELADVLEEMQLLACG